MDEDFRIKIGDDNIPYQEFNGKIYRLYSKERYFSRGTKRMHRVVWSFYNGKIPKGFHIHHKDGNTWNNSISNLGLIEAREHCSMHSKKKMEDKEWFERFWHKGVEAAKVWHASEEGREWHSEHGRKSWENRQTTTLKCSVCGKEYKTYVPSRSKYCGNNCKARALRARRKLERASL